MDDEDLLNVVATSGKAVGSQGGSENKATVDEKIHVNESGDSGKAVGSQGGPENKATVDEKIDENESGVDFIDVATWWDLCAKPGIKSFCIWFST